ncbi:UNVERIFIED_CONTAM: hypothetical protein Slati_1341400 [Sesamum latifolium]|uniref:Retrotransposon Copia-like N-terminal domain-containing protein n=1 Tax=Sesamum latifolium TaxID=2727402 RepID=A0AAW2XIL6_9LAMI
MAQDPEVLKVQPSDNPGMSLVSVPLDGNNFLSWSRSVRIALGAKMKLSFINEKGDKPEETDESYEQWVRADCMVTSWILNSIFKDIVESFMYTTTARELWVELETCFGQGNDPMVYQLKREIPSIAQGAMSVSAYFSKLKRLWDELMCFKPMAQCSCGASKTMSDTNNEDRLMQFLMGLNEPYDAPLPSVSKAYSMFLRVEKQREVHSGFPSSGQNMAMQARGNIFRRPGNAAVFQKRKTAAERRNQLCEHCGKNGHTKEVCFEIHGYPDWYRNLVEQRRRDGASTSRTYNVTSNEEHAQNTLDEIGISEIIRNEIQRYMGDAESAVTRAKDYQEFSDKSLAHTVQDAKSKFFWIIDSGATSHMCNDSTMFHTLNTNIANSFLRLADGTKHL